MGSLLVPAVAVAVAGLAIHRLLRWVDRHPFILAALRFLAGKHPDGKPRTNAGWFRAGDKPLTRSGHALRHWHKPTASRAVIHTGAICAVIAAIWGWLHYPLATKAVLAAALAVWLGSLALGFVSRQRRRTWELPLHLAVHEFVGVPRAAVASDYITVEVDGNSVKAAALRLPKGWPAEDKDKQRLLQVVCAKTGLESPEVSWRLAGPDPKLAITRSEPPPARVSLADIRDAIDRSAPDDLVWGLGKKKALVSTSLAGDSPHCGLSMASGAGKSVTARALVAQRLYKGDIALFLDIKMISHQWAQGLPNVYIARRPLEIHRALMWLAGGDGGEVQRRNEVALAGADLDGNVHSVVGPRLIVVCEELNATMAALRRLWIEMRDSDSPKRSPALDALDYTSFCGRQVLVNIIYIGQRLSVKAAGGDGDARENIGVFAFGRYSPSNWKMLAPDHQMPPSSRKPGRLQVVTDRVRETQGVFMTAREARALALAGTVTPLPAGMPGSRAVADGTGIELTSAYAPEQPVVSETSPHLGPPGGLVRLSEAVDASRPGGPVVRLSKAAIRKAQQRDPAFPARKGLDGVAALYDPVELQEWELARR